MLKLLASPLAHITFIISKNQLFFQRLVFAMWAVEYYPDGFPWCKAGGEPSGSLRYTLPTQYTLQKFWEYLIVQEMKLEKRRSICHRHPQFLLHYHRGFCFEFWYLPLNPRMWRLCGGGEGAMAYRLHVPDFGFSKRDSFALLVSWFWDGSFLCLVVDLSYFKNDLFLCNSNTTRSILDLSF